MALVPDNWIEGLEAGKKLIKDYLALHPESVDKEMPEDLRQSLKQTLPYLFNLTQL